MPQQEFLKWRDRYREAQAKKPMDISQKGLEFIADYEKFRPAIYLDEGGHPTIGYGHLIRPGEDFSAGLTHGQGLALYRKDLQERIDTVNKYLEVKVTQSQFDTLV